MGHLGAGLAHPEASVYRDGGDVACGSGGVVGVLTYLVSKGGTFGVEHRTYYSEMVKKNMMIIQWGPLRWLTPVLYDDVKFLSSPCEEEARIEADQWIKQQDEE